MSEFENGEFVEVRMAGDFVDDERGQGVIDPVSGHRYPFPIESGLRVIDRLEYEYYLEKRTMVLSRMRWSRENGYQVEPVENPEWSQWHDGSGYNKQGSVYHKLGHVKGVITRWNQLHSARQGRIKYEFRLFRRPVFTPPPWEPVELS